jgi:hypothetical protein
MPKASPMRCRTTAIATIVDTMLLDIMIKENFAVKLIEEVRNEDEREPGSDSENLLLESFEGLLLVESAC